MSNSFASMKKNRSVKVLQEKVSKLNDKKSYGDDRIWKPERDKAGNFSGIIRFLPAPKGESDPFVKVYNHGFKKNGKWFIENCPTTLGNECFCCEQNSLLWNSGIEDDKKIASHRKRKISYYSNIMVLKDPANPENEGKRFLYRFGMKIFEKIASISEGDTALGEDGVDVQNFWEGADFVLKMRNNGEWPTYEDSSFRQPSELFDGDEKALEGLWESLYPLEEFTAADKFPEYDDMKTKFEKFVHGSASVRSESTPENLNFDSMKPKADKPSFVNDTMKEQVTESSDESSDSGSPLDRFKNMLND